MPYPFFADTLSDGSSVNSYNIPQTYNGGEGEQEEGLAAVYQLRDIDSFIANVTVPPPPSSQSNHSADLKGQELSQEDISAFIIPPPPAPTTSSATLDDSSSSNAAPPLINAEDREVYEVKVNFRETREQQLVRDKISPKIALLQKQIQSPTAEEKQANFKGFQDTLTRKKSLDETATSFGRMTNDANRAEIFRQNSDLTSKNLPPPPPPPRSSVPKMLKQSYEFGGHQPQLSRPSNLKLLPSKPQTTTDAIGRDEASTSPATKKSPPAHLLSKMSLTSSNDSLSSNASVNTVKSVSPTKNDDDEAPPSLPPRQSPTKSPSRPPLASPESADSPVAVKPAVPSRAMKPTQSPVKEAVAKLNNNTSPLNRALPKIPKAADTNGKDPEKPALPQKTMGGNRKLPAVPPPPPKQANGHLPNNKELPPKPRNVAGSPLRINQSSTSTQQNGFVKMTNGHGGEHQHPITEVYTNKHFNMDDEGTSVDDDDIDDTDDGSSPPPTTKAGTGSTKLILGPPIGESNDDDSDEKLKQASRSIVFHKAEQVLLKVVANIDRAQDMCNSGTSSSGSESRSKDLYVKAKEQLTNESRQFVTASKLFVKSATESETQLMECLNHCVQMIDRIGILTLDVATHTPTPMQTQALIAKVRDVADTFMQTVLAAGNAVGRDMNDPSMNVLMKKATSLASVLTTLMRSLRVFN